MIVDALVLGVLPVLVIAAAVYDLTSYTIPNRLQILLMLGFIAFAFAAHLGLSAVALHLLAGFIGLVLGLTLFALGYIGGGDAKLFIVSLLWLGLHDLVAYTLITAILGGVLTLAILALRRLPLPGMLLRRSWILQLHDPKAGIPYGVALAGGLFAVLPHSEIFRIAAMA